MKSIKDSKRRILAMLLAMICITALGLAQQPTTTHYNYDANGRLSSVIYPDGTVVTYSYDAAGNITAISKQQLPPPTISGFTPSVGTVGTPVTINGSGFDSTAANDQVTFNLASGTASAATATSITTAVPAGATSGHVSVADLGGKATSTVDFFVPPPPFTAAQVAFTDRIVMGQLEAVNFAQANTIGLIVFDATAGQKGTLTVTANTITSSAITIFNPGGSTFASLPAITGAGASTGSQQFTVTGTYTVLVNPGANTGNITFTLANTSDVTGTIAIDGGPVNVAISSAGQRALLSFNETSGQHISLSVTNPSVLSSTISIQNPDGTTLTSLGVSLGSNSFIPSFQLPQTGSYSLVVLPQNGAVGAVTLALVSDIAATVSIGGPAVTVTVASPGQRARVSFAGTAGQLVSLTASNDTIDASVSVIAPDGSALLPPANAGSAAFTVLARQALPATGTYTIFVDPVSGSTGTVTFALLNASDVAGTITIGGPAVTVTSQAPGQEAKLTFSGNAGQLVSLTSTGIGSVTVLNPDGSVLGTPVFGFLDAAALPASGAYTVVVTPAVQGAAGAIVITLYDATPATGTITVGGPAVTVNITSPGQNANVTFAGTAGQNISLALSGFSFPLNVSTLNPDGTTLTGPVAAGSQPINVTLGATGTYTVFLDPQGPATGSITATLTAAAASSLSLGGPPVAVSLNSGQPVQLTLDATQGQRVLLQFTGVTITQAFIDLFNPDGSPLGSNPLLGDLATVGSRGLNLDIQSMPQTGTCTVQITPGSKPGGGVYSGSLTLRAVSEQTPAATAVGVYPGVPLAVVITQSGIDDNFTFTGAAGHRIAMDAVSQDAVITLFNPDGTTLDSASLGSEAGEFTPEIWIGPDGLPGNGQYTLRVNSPQDDTSTVLLYDVPADTTTPVTADGTAFTATVAAPGQVVNFNFSSSVGQRFSAMVDTSGIANILASAPSGIEFFDPSGKFLLVPVTALPFGLATAPPSGLLLGPFAAQTTGTYTLQVATQGSGPVTVSVFTVPPDLTGTLNEGGPPLTLTITEPGQAASINVSAAHAALQISADTIPSCTVAVEYSDSSVSGRGLVSPPGGLIPDIDTVLNPGGPSIQPVSISIGGPYTGSITLALISTPDVTASIATDSNPVTVTTTTPGQDAVLTFSGTVGQVVSATVSATGLEGANVTLAPSNSTTRLAFPATVANGTAFIDAVTLPSTGQYTITVDPTDPQQTGSATVTVFNVVDVQGTIAVNGAATHVVTAVPGQDAELTFQGLGGQQFTVHVASNAIGLMTVTLLQPDGTFVTIQTSDSASFDLPSAVLTTGGLFTVKVDPFGPATGSVDISVSSP